MGLSLFLNSLLELCLSFSSECLYTDINTISILVLSLLLLMFIWFVGIPSIPTFRRNEHTQKRQGRGKRRRKGGTRQGSRYHHSKEEDRELISFLRSPLGRNYDITSFRQLLCPDPSCQMCNNVTTEISGLFSKALEDSTPSVSPAPVIAPVTEPSFIQSSAFPGVPSGELIPTPLPEPSSPSPSILSSNSMTTLGNFLSPSPPGQTLSPEPVHHSSPKPKDWFSSTVTQYDLRQGFLALQSTKISFGADPAAKFIDPRHLLYISPDEHDSAQEYSNPKTLGNHLKQKLAQLFWGLPSLHSESLSSAVHASGDYSIFFNSVSNSFTDQESSGLPYFQPPSLPEVQPQALPQTLPQSQHLHLTQIQTEAHLQAPVPILPSNPITQNTVCEVYFHTPKNESECHTSSETEHRECNVLQKEQERLWGLPSAVQSSKAHVAISINPVEFPLSSEFREEFEHHLRKRLIQFHEGQPCMTQESLSLIRPLSNCSGIAESKSSSGLSWISVDKDQKTENKNVALSQPGSFYERSSERFQLEDNEGKVEGQSQDNDPKVHLLSDSKTSSDTDVGSGSELMSLSRENSNSMISEHSVSQRLLENVQKVHVSQKIEKISEGQLPTNQISPIKSQTELEQRSLPTSVGGDYCLNTSQEPPLLERGAQEMEKPPTTKFQMRMLSGLPTKVLESKEHFEWKDTSSPSSINPTPSPSTELISEMNTKYGPFMPLGGSSESLLGDKVVTENAADHLKFPLPDTVPVGKKGHKQADVQCALLEEIQKILKAKLPVTNTISGEKSQIHSLIANFQPPKLPARQAGTPQKTKNNSVHSNDRAKIWQGANREKSEPASRPSMSREIVRAEGLKALQPKTNGTLTTSKPGISQRVNRETTVTTANPLSKLPVKAPNMSELKMQVMVELKLMLDKGNNSQGQGPPKDMSEDSESLTYKASLTSSKCLPSVNTEVHQVLRVHSEDTAVPMEKQQEPWLPKHVLRSCQDQNSPPAVEKDTVCPPPQLTAPKYDELGAGDAQLRISQPGGKRFPPQDTDLKDKLGSKSFHSLSEKEEAPSESLFINKMKKFCQLLLPRLNYKVYETPQKKGIPRYSAQSRGQDKSRAPFTGNAQVHRVMSDTGKFPEEKRGRRPAAATSCPQEPLPSAVQSGKPVRKEAVQAQAEPVQGRPFHRRAPFFQVTNAGSGSGHHTATLAGQGSTSSTHTRNEDRHTKQNDVALKGQQIYQNYPRSVPIRGTVPHPSPNCSPQAAKRPPTLLTTAGGTALKNQPPRFRHTMLLYDCQGETFPTPK